MRFNPTVAIARIAATAPIRAAGFAIEAPDLEDDSEPVKFITSQFKDRWTSIKREMLLALDYGWYGAEKVYEAEGGRIVLKQIKGLLPTETEIKTDKGTGEFVGFVQGPVTVDSSKCMLFTNDKEYGNYYGLSRHENIRETAWHPWCETLKKMAQYVTKSAGILPYLEYPMGQSYDKNGALVDNHDIAQKVLTSLGTGSGVAMPRTYIKDATELQDMIRNGVDISKLRAWQLSFLEVASGHGAEFVEMLRHFERLMLRGWLVPERTIAEGTTGTRADAEAHADVAIVAAQETLSEMTDAVNKQVVDQLLLANFGQSMVGKVYIATPPLERSKANMIRGLITQILTNPNNTDLALRALDVDAMLDISEVPKRDKTVDLLGEMDEADAATGEPTQDATDPATGKPVVKATPGVPAAGDTTVSDVTFNGAQVTSALEVLLAVGDGRLAPEAAVSMLVQFFRTPEPQARAMVKAQEGIDVPDTTTPPATASAILAAMKAGK
jgi:hypothetical protein